MPRLMERLHARRAKKDNERLAEPAGRRSRSKKLLHAMLLFVSVLLLVLPPLLLSNIIAYAPLIMALLSVAVSYASMRVAASGIDVDEEIRVDSCERGSKVPLKVRIRNGSLVPIARLEAVFFISDIQGGYDVVTSVSVSMNPREDLDLLFDARFAHLGRYNAGIDRIVVHDLIGLFSRNVELASHSSVDVRPKLFDIGTPDMTHVTLEETSKMFRPIVTDEFDYSGVREYRPGDPLKTVHWNLSGRIPDGKLYTRLFEVYAEPGLAVIVDAIAPDYGVENLMSAFDSLVESAASISNAAQELGVESEVRYIDREGAPCAAHLEKTSDVDMLVHTMMPATPAQGQRSDYEAIEMLAREANAPQGKGNVAYCACQVDDAAISALVDMRMRRRNPILFLAVPRQIEDAARTALLEPLKRLAAAGVPYFIVETNEVMTEVKAS